jgi:hypothetical protein
MVVPEGVTGVGFAVRLWMMGPPAALVELVLALELPPLPEPPLLVLPELALLPPWPEPPPLVLDVDALPELVLALAVQ